MNLGSLVSETRNPQTMDLDALSTLELVNRFNQQDTLVALAVKETLPGWQRPSMLRHRRSRRGPHYLYGCRNQRTTRRAGCL